MKCLERMMVLMVVCTFLLSGCSVKEETTEKIKDCDFTVVESVEIPKDLQSIIEEKKSEPFKLSYADEGYLYLVMGYGKQVGGGYSITVNQLYETETTICFETTLIGPKEEERSSAETFPYIVVKIEYVEKDVVYQ